MRPDSIDPLPERIKTEPMSRVHPTRQKEREERDREADDRERRKPPRREDRAQGETGVAEGPGKNPAVPAPGKSPRRGKHLDLTI